MSSDLTNHIINHIYYNLGLNSKIKPSLKDNIFILKDTLDFIDEDDGGKCRIWGGKISVESSNFRVIVSSLSDKENVLITKLDGCPTYGCYLNNLYEGLICYSINKNEWLPAGIALQASFLSGMEALKNVPDFWSKIDNYQDLIEELKSFIEFEEGRYER